MIMIGSVTTEIRYIDEGVSQNTLNSNRRRKSNAQVCLSLTCIKHFDTPSSPLISIDGKLRIDMNIPQRLSIWFFWCFTTTYAYSHIPLSPCIFICVTHSTPGTAGARSHKKKSQTQ